MSRYRRYQIAISDGIKRSKYSRWTATHCTENARSVRFASYSSSSKAHYYCAFASCATSLRNSNMYRQGHQPASKPLTASVTERSFTAVGTHCCCQNREIKTDNFTTMPTAPVLHTGPRRPPWRGATRARGRGTAESSRRGPRRSRCGRASSPARAGASWGRSRSGGRGRD